MRRRAPNFSAVGTSLPSVYRTKQDGGEGGIRTVCEAMLPVTCRFYIPTVAMNATNPSARCSLLHPGSYLTARGRGYRVMAHVNTVEMTKAAHYPRVGSQSARQKN
jgi:hypothetical protein